MITIKFSTELSFTVIYSLNTSTQSNDTYGDDDDNFCYFLCCLLCVCVSCLFVSVSSLKISRIESCTVTLVFVVVSFS